MTSEKHYKVQKFDGKWEVMLTFSAGYATEAEAQAEADRRNAKLPQPKPAPQPTQQSPTSTLTNAQRAELGITILPDPAKADRIFRNWERYSEEPPED